MNAHNRRILARKCKRLGITAEHRRPESMTWIPAWAPLINGRQVTTDAYRGEIPIWTWRKIAALRYALNHAEQS